MNWPALELAVGMIVIGAAVNWISMTVFFWWKRRQQVPDELHKDVECLRNDVVALRVDIARIKGRLNFKAWTKET
jgi:hypothetical protein